MRRRWAAGLMIVAFAAFAGCDRASDDRSARAAEGSANAPSATNPPAAVPATRSSPATSPATTRAAVESLMDIDGTLVLFPPARLRVDESDGKVVARLFSDDPKGAALDENYEGNSFYLQIELDADDVQDGDAKALDGVVLTYRAPTSERDDSPYGIFLEGRRWVLQPGDVRVAFEGTASPLDVRVTGTFLMFDTDDETAKPRRAKVAATLSASVQALR